MCPPMTMKSQCGERSAFHCHLMGRANMFRPLRIKRERNKERLNVSADDYEKPM